MFMFDMILAIIEMKLQNRATRARAAPCLARRRSGVISVRRPTIGSDGAAVASVVGVSAWWSECHQRRWATKRRGRRIAWPGRDPDELRECLLSWKRKRLQKLARVLRVNPALSNLELVSMVLETTAAVRQRPHSGGGSDTTGKTPTLRRRADPTATTAPEEPQDGRGSRQRKSRGQVVTGLTIDAESPCEGEPRGKTVAGTANSLSTADLPADPQCNAQCQACKLPFYTASGKAVCVDCREGESTVDDIVCVSCGRGDSEELLMLCEGCENACHTFCCEPRLDTIPESDWFCGSCSGRRKTQKHFADRL